MSIKLALFLVVFGLVAQEAHSQWFGWPYYGLNYGYLGYYGKRSVGFDANAAVTGSTPPSSQPINAYPSGMVFASTTTQTPQNMVSTESSSTAQPEKH